MSIVQPSSLFKMIITVFKVTEHKYNLYKYSSILVSQHCMTSELQSHVTQTYAKSGLTKFRYCALL